MKKIFTFLFVGALVSTQALAVKNTVSVPERHANAFTADLNISHNKAISPLNFRNEIKKGQLSNIQAIAKTVQTVSDEATSDNPTENSTEVVTYHFPAGTFYSQMYFYRLVQNGETAEYTPLYMSGEPLTPYGEVTWKNLTYDPNTGLIIESPVSAWEYLQNYYGYEKPFYSESDNNIDLKISVGPCEIQNYSIDVPKLTVNNASYQYAKGSYDENDNPIETVGSNDIGGNGLMNPGVIDFYNNNLGTKDWSSKQFLNDINSPALLTSYGYNNLIGAGTSTAMYGTASVNEVRNTYITRNEIEVPENSSFVGFGQLFTTGNVAPIIKSIALEAYCKLKRGDEITINLLDLTNNEQVTSGIYSYPYTTDFDRFYIEEVGFEIYDEENDKDYIALKPNTQYILYVDGVENLEGFVPTLMPFDVKNHPNIQQAFDGDIFLIYQGENGLSAIDGNYYAYDLTGQVETGGYAPSMNWKLEVEYPYTIPAYALTAAAGGTPDRFEISDTEVDVKWFGVQDLTVAQIDFISDMDVKDLEANMEFSSEELKNAIYYSIIKRNDYESVGGFALTTTAKYLQVIAKESIPAGSWIKLNNKNTSLKINLPAYEMSGIGDVVADGEALATEYFDLQGRKLAGEANGIVIKKMTMADGSVKAVKVVK